MTEYLISKYDPQYCVDCVYTHNEWSGESDIGKVFPDGMLTRETYESTIDEYVECALEILSNSYVEYLIITDIETGMDVVKYKEREVLDMHQVEQVIADCLHEKYWCRLSAKDTFVHFGYDMYIYIGCKVEYSTVSEICKRHGLFAFKKESPYKKIDEA